MSIVVFHAERNDEDGSGMDGGITMGIGGQTSGLANKQMYMHCHHAERRFFFLFSFRRASE